MKRIAVSVLALALSAAAGSAFANHQDNGYGSGYDNANSNASSRVDYAQVLRVDPIGNQYGSNYGNGGYQRQECWNEQTNGYENGYYRDSSGRLYRGNTSRGITQKEVIGALIGGALGNQVGKGDGRKAATIAGIVAGAAIANHTGDGRYANNDYDQYRDNSGVVRRCRTVYENGGNNYDNGYGNQGGYNVTYRYAGQTYRAVTRTNPGRSMRVVVSVRPQDDSVAYGR